MARRRARAQKETGQRRFRAAGPSPFSQLSEVEREPNAHLPGRVEEAQVEVGDVYDRRHVGDVGEVADEALDTDVAFELRPADAAVDLGEGGDDVAQDRRRVPVLISALAI